jgi:AcrR family transcriptional regulator
LKEEEDWMGRATASGEPASNKRAAVLAAAVRCFAARGLAGTGMRDIARAAGLTEGTLYHYFPSKDALIDSAFRWSAFQPADVRTAMQQPELPLRERLLAVGGEFLAALRRNPGWSRLVIRESLRAGPEGARSPVRAALVSLAGDRTRALALALEDERAARRIRDCDPRRVAEHLFRALIGHFVAEAIAASGPPPGAGVDPFLAHLVDTIAAGLQPGAPPARARARRRSPRGRGR